MTALEDLQSALADRYEVERELGRGGMATVYLAKDLEHDRQVAIKVMRPQIAEVMGAERFLREIEIAGSLEHPNILALLDSGSTDDLMYYVMPFIEGESLGERIEREGRMGIETVLQITREVASALTYASGKGVIHRDIKPDNIMLNAEGHAVVMDFGIGKALEAGGQKLTQTGMSVGTPAYMSPEQAMGEGDVDGRTDVYSLAAVVYEMLVGEQPFTGPTAQVIIAKRFSGQVPSAVSRRNVVPPAMDAAIQTALSVNRDDRFATAEELVGAMAGEVSTAKKSAAKRSGCGSKAAAAMVVVLALAAALAMSL
jgi:serine/threonine-protein kinase